MAIPPLLYKVRDLYGEMAGKKNLQFLLEIDPSLAPGHLADPLRLRQILQNFVSNAIKFTSQGKITLKLTVLAADEQQQTLCFSCSDTGIGISPDSLSILFQPFTQAESSTTRRFGGTGLGLAICKRLGDQMGGAVELDSQQYGGTTARLTVTLPRANFIPLEAEPEPAAPLAAPEHPVHAQMAPILFVEDNPTNRKLTMMQLDRIGVPYHVAENGQQAFDMWMQQPYSLVLTDCHMPIMDGHQLARAIRSSEAEIPGLPAVPIIACTANIGKDEADRAMAAGMNEVLTKPIGLEPLRKTLNAWLQQSQINETATAPAAAEPQNAEIIDRETLKIYSQGDLSIELGILQDFLSSEMEDREALRKAVSGQNHKDARWSTHRIKGAGRMVGALPLARAAENLEQCAKQQGAMDQALQTLEQAFEAVALWVETHTSDTTPI
jgi:CheY-like chemotaxis protein/HPt (histidine-containing phosphotransfer) domain-containing protein/anti-sigma regulatory factor (Ser/Thr protein kinase)